MSLSSWFLAVAAAGLIIWRARRLALAGMRRRIVVACHAGAFLVLCAALWAPPKKLPQEVSRRIVYLVDRSASMDSTQQQWTAERIASLEAKHPAHLPRAVVVFGAEAKQAAPFSQQPLMDTAAVEQLLAGASVDKTKTNLETALVFSASLIRPHPEASIVLLSDGRQTVGSASNMAAYLRRFGIRVYPQAPPLVESVKAVWDALYVPPVVQRGASVPVRLVVFNAAEAPKTAEVQVSVKEVILKRQAFVLRPGWQVISVAVRALARGTLPLDVRLTIAADRFAETRVAYTEVEGPPQFLWVAERLTELPALAQSLKRRDMDVAVMRPSELPTDSQRLQDYDAILLFNLPKSAFSNEQVEALRGYVEEQGGGLVSVGLGGDLAKELQTKSALDDLLPLAFEPKGVQEAKRRVCFVLLIDRSASMLGPRIAATKRAAVELVKQLQPEDLVGVLAFDTQAYVVAEVQPASQVGSWLVEKLVKLHSTGGTDILPALSAAANRLALTGATVKHIILLSDGNTPFQQKAYDAVIRGFQQDNTTVSAIGIGPAFVNADFLRWLSGSTGGSYYLMRSPQELPRLVVQDTQQQLGKLPFAEGYFRPKKTETTDWFSETGDWPALRGFFTATAKPKASVDLAINGGEGDEPLLARWVLGRGRVVSFASDADARWSPDWIRWPGFDATWAEVVRWAFKPRLTEEVFVWVDERAGVQQLMIEGALNEPSAELVAADQSQRIPLSLIPIGSLRWRVVLEQVPSGWHQLLLTSQQGQAVLSAKRWVQLGEPPAAAELSGQPPQENLLREIAQQTGGAYNAPDQAFVPPTSVALAPQPVFFWWLPVALVLLLIEVALRGSSML